MTFTDRQADASERPQTASHACVCMTIHGAVVRRYAKSFVLICLNDALARIPSQFSRRDVQARGVRGSLQDGGCASALAMASDEWKLYVADRFDDAISTVSLRSNSVIASIPVDRRASGSAAADE